MEAPQGLSPDTLVLFLKDRTFVEYLNSFLLLPLFSTQVFYDTTSGSFQLVSTPLPHYNDESSASTTTLYITEDDISGLFLDSHSIIQWIIEERLPLFINSDIYSEYLLCHSLKSSSRRVLGKLSQDERSTPFLAGRDRKKSSRQRSSRTRSGGQRSIKSSRRRNEFENPGKAEMKQFKMFLKDKSGLKNWLFCIDFLQLMNTTGEKDKNKLFKEIRERYFTITSSLALSNEPVSVCVSGSLTLNSLRHVYDTLLEGLTNYWYPRFLLSIVPFTSSGGTISHSLSLPSVTLYDDKAPHPSDVTTPTIRLVSKPRPQLSRPSTQPTQSIQPSHRTQSRLVWTSGSQSSIEPKSIKLAKFNKYPIVPSGRTSITGTPVLPHTLSTNELQVLSINGTPIALDERLPYYNDNHKLFMKCLAVERRKCGGYFQNFLQSLEQKVYLNCLHFWRETQSYKMLFFASDFNPILVETKAKLIYSFHILECSQASIDCPRYIIEYISGRLWPPFEDIFDKAEEHALNILEEKWIELCQRDRETFEQMQSVNSDLSLHHVSALNNKELDKLSEEYSSLGSSSTESMGSVSIISSSPQPVTVSPAAATVRVDPSANDRVAPSANIKQVSIHHKSLGEDEERSSGREANFNDVIKNPKELEFFKIFLNDNGGAIDLKFWLEIESFRSLPTSDMVLKNMKAKKIRSDYFNKLYLFGDSSPFSKETQREVVSFGGSHKLPLRPKSPVFREAQKHIRSRLEKKWIPLFTRSPDYLERHGVKDSSNETKEEVIDSSKVYTESEDTLKLKQTLYDSKRCELFKTFLCIKAPKGTNTSNNVDFWLEIQRFKEMFHYQMNHSLLFAKMKAILNCYIQSPCNPKLQVTLPLSVADELVSKPFGPYMFREAQNCIFRYLQTAWEDYQSFCESHPNRPLAEALVELRDFIANERQEAEERIKMKELLSATQSPLAHLETEEERKARKAKEKELREFGEIGVSFKLSSPQPTYTYCGQISSLQHKLHPELGGPSHSSVHVLESSLNIKFTDVPRVRFHEPIQDNLVKETGLARRRQRSQSVPSRSSLAKGFRLRRNTTTTAAAGIPLIGSDKQEMVPIIL